MNCLCGLKFELIVFACFPLQERWEISFYTNIKYGALNIINHSSAESRYLKTKTKTT